MSFRSSLQKTHEMQPRIKARPCSSLWWLPITSPGRNSQPLASPRNLAHLSRSTLVSYILCAPCSPECVHPHFSFWKLVILIWFLSLVSGPRAIKYQISVLLTALFLHACFRLVILTAAVYATKREARYMYCFHNWCHLYNFTYSFEQSGESFKQKKEYNPRTA